MPLIFSPFFSLFLKKYVDSEFKITDDSQLFEFFNRSIPVKVVEGEYSNIKITTAEDILFAKAYIKKRIESVQKCELV